MRFNLKIQIFETTFYCSFLYQMIFWYAGLNNTVPLLLQADLKKIYSPGNIKKTSELLQTCHYLITKAMYEILPRIGLQNITRRPYRYTHNCHGLCGYIMRNYALLVFSEHLVCIKIMTGNAHIPYGFNSMPKIAHTMIQHW